jgi:glycosyltransferase involved in cell wall biosynthesis
MTRIGLDLRPTEPGFKAHHGRGTGRYAAELVRQFTGNPAFTADPQLELVPVPGERLRGSRAEQRLLSLAPCGRVTLETQFVLPRSLGRLGVDLMHFFAHGDAPAHAPLPYVVTVLDLIPLKFADLYRPQKATWRFRLARHLENQAVRSAVGVLAISEATKRDVVEILGFSPDRVSVTPLAVGPEFTPEVSAGEDRAVRTALGLAPGEPFLLYVGGIDQRKNALFLVRMYRALCEALGGEAPRLAMVGRYEREEMYPVLAAEVRRLGLAGRVLFPGFLPDGLLPALYRTTELKLFPSLYEGFGLPVLEAMACGAPVAAGRNSSIPEVAGPDALLLPDNDVEAWVREIAALLRSAEGRRALGARGLARARLFSWERTAALTVEAYRRFLPGAAARVR